MLQTVNPRDASRGLSSLWTKKYSRKFRKNSGAVVIIGCRYSLHSIRSIGTFSPAPSTSSSVPRKRFPNTAIITPAVSSPRKIRRQWHSARSRASAAVSREWVTPPPREKPVPSRL